jgi:hypothetical protein
MPACAFIPYSKGPQGFDRTFSTDGYFLGEQAEQSLHPITVISYVPGDGDNSSDPRFIALQKVKTKTRPKFFTITVIVR